MLKDEVEEGPLFLAEMGADVYFGFGCTDFPGYGRESVGNVGQDVEEIAFFGVDDPLHFG